MAVFSTLFEPWYDYDSPVDFTYRISDGLEWSYPAPATIQIDFVNGILLYAEEDAFGMNGAELDQRLRSGGARQRLRRGRERHRLRCRRIRLMHKGTVDLHADGSFSYTRDPGESGRDPVHDQVYDSGGATGNRVFVYLYPGLLLSRAAPEAMEGLYL